MHIKVAIYRRYADYIQHVNKHEIVFHNLQWANTTNISVAYTDKKTREMQLISLPPPPRPIF